MHNYTKWFAAIYGAWCLLWVVVAVVSPGEPSIAAHLSLAFTGMPLALFSLWLPHATPHAVFAAAVIGLVQWTLVTECFARWDAWRRS